MSTREDLNTSPTATTRFEKFSDPRTIPGGWDLTALESRRNGRTPYPDERSLEDPEYGDGSDTPKSGSTWEREQFPKPRTIPAGWDTSALK